MTLIDPDRAAAGPATAPPLEAAPIAPATRDAKPSLLERAVRSRLDDIERGSLTVITPSGVAVYGTPPGPDDD